MSAAAVAPARWQGYADATRLDHFAWWCQEHCIQSIDEFAGLPLVLEPWQLDMMGEALAEAAEDVPYWLAVALVIPKKNGKTSLLAAFALYHLLEDDGAPEILLAAATDKQAGRLFDSATAFVRSSPYLAARLHVREHVGELACVDGFGRLYRVSAEGALAGYNPSLVVADELAEWSTPTRRKAWGSIATAGRMARRRAFVFTISTAGEPAERIDGILGQLIDRNELEGDVEQPHAALTISRNHCSRTLVYNYDAHTRDPHDMAAIRRANPASWVTTERLAETAASPELTPGKFLQLHGCVWAASEPGYLELDAWRKLASDAEPEAGEGITVGFRGGDVSALVACRRQDGLLFPLEVWELPDGEAPEAEDIDDVLAEAVATFRVGVIYASTSPAWASLADSWRTTYGKRQCVDVDIAHPSAHTAQVTERFRADALAGRVRHTGDATLARHVVSAQVARTRNLPYLVPGSRRGSPIAACVAAVLAWEARAVLGPGRERSKVPVSL